MKLTEKPNSQTILRHASLYRFVVALIQRIPLLEEINIFPVALKDTCAQNPLVVLVVSRYLVNYPDQQFLDIANLPCDTIDSTFRIRNLTV